MSGVEQRLREGLAFAAVDATTPADPVVWVRSRVARDRRRRVIGAVVAGVALSGAVSLALPSLPDGEGRLTGSVASQPPATAPTPADDVFTLQADPLLTEADLARLATGSGWRRVGSSPHRLLDCMRPGSEPGTERRVAAYEETSGSGRITEFVLRYDDASAAHAAVDELERQFSVCPRRADQTDQSGRVDYNDPSSPGYFYEPLMDEDFGATRSWPGPVPLTPEAITMDAARDGNVVVVFEMTGWHDRGSVRLVKALNRAIGNQGGRCDKDDKFKRQNLSFTPSGFSQFQSYERGCT